MAPGTYYYRVRAFAGAVDSRYSNITLGITLPLPSGIINHPIGFFNHDDLQANGIATFAIFGSTMVARVTTPTGGNTAAGSIFSKAQVNVSNFTTSFVFLFHDPTNRDGVVGNGITFIIEGNSPTALGGTGDGLGYGPDPSGGGLSIPNSTAVKFDTIDNQGEGPNSTGLFLTGVSPTVPAVDLRNTPINLRSQHPFRVDLSYDGTTLTETITDLNTNGTFTTTYTVNIPAAVGGDVAYVGFGGGVGSHDANQDILSWTYNTSTGSGGTLTTAIAQAPATDAGATALSVPVPSSAAGGATSGNLTSGAASGGSAVMVGPAATGPSPDPGQLAANGSADPRAADQVSADLADAIPLRTRMKIKKIDGYLDDLAATLN